MSNVEDLKLIKKRSVVMEMTEMTRRGDVVWNEISPGQYHSDNGSYDFYLTKTGGGSVLDVMKFGQRYTFYNSATLSEVADLYDFVDRLGGDSSNKGKIVSVCKFFGDIERGC